MSKTNKKFNPEIMKKLREKKGLSQEDLMVDLSNIGLKKSKNTLQKWENGITAPDVNDMAVVASFFGVPIQAFYE